MLLPGMWRRRGWPGGVTGSEGWRSERSGVVGADRGDYRAGDGAGCVVAFDPDTQAGREVSRGHLNGRAVINLDSGDGRQIVCSWDECDHRGVTLYQHHECVHDARIPCERADANQVAYTGFTHGAHRVHVFCTERHRAYFVNAYGRNAHESMARTGRAYGNLPAGMRGMIG